MIELVALALAIGGGYVLIPHLGAAGAATAMLVQRLVSAASTIGWAHRHAPAAALASGDGTR